MTSVSFSSCPFQNAVIEGKEGIALTLTLFHSEMNIIRHCPFVKFIRMTVLEAVCAWLHDAVHAI
ncbi:MAG: hypothetical protein AB7H70_15620 [Rhodospirillaceae bacterium]